MEPEKKDAEGQRFDAHRKIVGARLVDRINELQPFVALAIDRLRGQLSHS